MSEQQYKYYAFISYSSHDAKWGRRLQRKLEGYKMPATLCHQRGWKRQPIKPIFFAPTDIQPGELTAELQNRLKASRNLIVICSPHSAQSKWVGEEIAYFHSLGRTANIHFFIVDGIPHSGDPATECFNPIVDELGLPEILGANIHEKNYWNPWLNRERAYVQLITKLLGVEFDAIWKRHTRLLIRDTALSVAGGLMVISAIVGTWWMNRSVDVGIQVVEASELNENLPSARDAIVTLILDNETKIDTIDNFDVRAHFTNIPNLLIGQDVVVSARCKDFLPIDTTLRLSKDVRIELYRNPNVYGKIRATIYKLDKSGYIPLPNQTLSIGGYETVSDEGGSIEINIPLHDQHTTYAITANRALETDSITLPCGNSDAIIVK